MRPTSFDFFNKPLPRELQEDLLMVMYYRDDSFGPLLFHDHSFTEIMLIQEGSVSIDFGDSIVKAGEKCCIFIPPDCTHRTVIHQNTEVYSRMILHLDEQQLIPMLRASYPILESSLEMLRTFCVVPLNDPELNYLLNRLVRIKANQRMGDLYSKPLILAILYEFLCFFARRKESTDSPNFLTKHDPMLERILTLIDERFSEEDFNCADVANELFLSQGYLSRLFKEKMGTSLYRYIVDKRLEHAKALIDTGSPVLKAAVEAGYSDYSSFLRAYKARYHQTPRESQSEYHIK